MARKFKESKLAKRWLKDAKHDLHDAIVGHHHGIYADTICYLCHQATEKALKAFLLAQGMIGFPHIHVLPTLLNLCIKFDKEMKNLKGHAKTLDRYYIETKYPSDIPIKYSKQEVKKAIDLASEVLDFVEKKIKKSAN